MRKLLLNETNTVAAGASIGGAFKTAKTILGPAHLIIGAIELYNYSAEWISHGCEEVEHDDHFRSHICTIWQAVTGSFASTSVKTEL